MSVLVKEMEKRIHKEDEQRNNTERGHLEVVVVVRRSGRGGHRRRGGRGGGGGHSGDFGGGEVGGNLRDNGDGWTLIIWTLLRVVMMDRLKIVVVVAVVVLAATCVVGGGGGGVVGGGGGGCGGGGGGVVGGNMERTDLVKSSSAILQRLRVLPFFFFSEDSDDFEYVSPSLRFCHLLPSPSAIDKEKQLGVVEDKLKCNRRHCYSRSFQFSISAGLPILSSILIDFSRRSNCGGMLGNVLGLGFRPEPIRINHALLGSISKEKLYEETSRKKKLDIHVNFNRLRTFGMLRIVCPVAE
ncbi:hypothetical protein LXL04_028973 [Taraxacum kok-saghyz]